MVFPAEAGEILADGTADWEGSGCVSAELPSEGTDLVLSDEEPGDPEPLESELSEAEFSEPEGTFEPV